jgi:DNA-binding NtrC family response regulator
LERALLLSQGQSLTIEHFAGLDSVPAFTNYDKGISNLENIEEAHIKAVIKHCGGDTRKAADILGISRATLYRKLKKGRQNN